MSDLPVSQNEVLKYAHLTVIKRVDLCPWKPPPPKGPKKGPWMLI